MGTRHLVHGLSDAEVAPDWPPLEAAEVHALVATFPGLGGRTEIAWRSPRPLSAAARVRTPAGEVFVKRHHGSVRSASDLAAEHALAAHLRARGIPVPEIRADRDGHTAIARDVWTYEVHAIADGLDVYRDTMSWTPLTDLGQARTAGRMLARLHQAVADFDAPQRTTAMLVSRDDLLRAPELADAIAAQCARRPALAEYVSRCNWRADIVTLARRHRAVQPRVAHLAPLWTHNDWHVSNLCWASRASDAAITAVLDFGLASCTFAWYDLATAIERNAIAWLHLERGMQAAFPDTARALIAGYHEALPVTGAERALLADLLPIVHMDFALSELEYFQAVTHTPERADVAYRTFLLGHAAWFDTVPGRVLLDAVRA